MEYVITRMVAFRLFATKVEYLQRPVARTRAHWTHRVLASFTGFNGVSFFPLGVIVQLDLP